MGYNYIMVTNTTYPKILSIGAMNDRQVKSTLINHKRYTAKSFLVEFGNNPIATNGLRHLGGELYISECDQYVAIYHPHGSRAIYLIK